MKKATSLDQYFEIHSKWNIGLMRLREILLQTELTETLKWNAPTYTINGKNVVAIGAFKNYFGLWFFNGVFLKDTNKVLENAQEGKTKALRQWRFTSADEINDALILQYVNEAIANEKQGLKLKPQPKPKKSIQIPDLLQNVLTNNNVLATQFKALTPYKQREYCEYINGAKREATKLSRLENIKPLIEKGIGLNDKYRNC